MKTGEMLTYLLDHPEAKFKRLNGGDVLYGLITSKTITNLKLNVPAGSLRVDEDWELVPEAVDFMTAINSGKRITCERRVISNCDPDWILTHNCLTVGLINSKWYIEN